MYPLLPIVCFLTLVGSSSALRIMAAQIAGPTTSSVLIWCHGSGDTGPGAQAYVEAVTPAPVLQTLSGIRFVYPTAEPRSYALAGGALSSVWFDRVAGMAPSNPEHTQSVEESAARLNSLIDQLVTSGVPSEQIVLGGFSMGGGISLQTAARSPHRLGAVFALSSYLCDDSRLWQKLQLGQEGTATDATPFSRGLVPVYMAHGSADDFVRLAITSSLHDCPPD